MTQEQKEILLKDLCARLPYGVKVGTIDNGGSNVETEHEFYRNITVDEFINYFKNDKSTIK